MGAMNDALLDRIANLASQRDRGSKDTREFSLARMFAGMRDGHLSGLERELLEQSARDAGQNFDPQRVQVPWKFFLRDLTAASASAGGYLVGTAMSEVVDILRPWSVTARAGITIFDGLRESLPIPKVSTKSSGNWLTNEATQVTESTPVLGQTTLQPKLGGGYVELSRQFSLQAAGEQFARMELLRTVGSLLDVAVLNGSGASGQPLGLLNTVGIGTQSGTSLAYSGVLNMKETCATANAVDANIAYIGTPAVRELLEGRERATGSGFIWDNDRVASRPAYVTTDVPASTLICGDWSEIILGLWGSGLQVEVNPYANFQAGIIGARIIVGCDVAVKHAASFCVATSVT